MISVIMPTMWVPEATLDTIKLISKNKHVGEIIIIDNAPELNMSVEGIDKVTYTRESTNTFVNPAWNKGVRLTNIDYLIEDLNKIGFKDITYSIEEPWEDTGHPNWVYVKCYK